MMKLVLVRHGESEWNKLNLFTGWTDVDLSEKGHEEAKQAGRTLKEAGYDFDVCYTSYLKRAIHTLNHILDEMDRNWLPVIKTWKLNERHYGALQGLNKSETAEKYGEDQVKLWRRSYDVKPPALEADDERAPKNQAAYRDENPDLMRKLTVACNITEETEIVPMLILHGTADMVVNCRCSVNLYRRLRECGKDAALFLMKGSGHAGPEFYAPRVLNIVHDFALRVFGMCK